MFIHFLMLKISKGLGKNENGISEALKPKLKRSVTGVGHDAASDFTEHWWTSLYNKAAGNVEVTEKNGKTKKIKTNTSDFQITNSTWKLNKPKADTEEEQYADYFIKKATLTNGGVKIEKVKESDSESEEPKDVLKMTDEELFAACEGRTAHKGARHGLKASGKLARIEQQEQMLLAKPQYEGYSHAKKQKNKPTTDLQVEDLNLNSDADVPKSKKKKNKKKHCLNSENTSEIVKENNDNQTAKSTEAVPDKIKKKRKATNDNVATEMELNKKSKKPKSTNEINITSPDVGCLFKSKKKKRNQSTIVQSTEAECANFINTDAKYEFLENGVVRKNKKKNKKEDK
ncbi:G patch domain-containing protein 4-like isoform X2 [Choristoneura fumiferana]|uniref:G patch domain-containing protein 4-like isoform X2 n=1 Tax=Choristoneura fumiferana TaxID=7141 RepID=UPI003D15A117